MRDKFPSKTMLATIIALVVAITGSAGLVLVTKSEDNKPRVAVVAPAEQQHKNFTYLKYQGKTGSTALALLKAAAAVETKDSAYGPYVDSINGVTGGTDGKYWAFYVNGALAQVGADAYTTKHGDSIEWKLE